MPAGDLIRRYASQINKSILAGDVNYGKLIHAQLIKLSLNLLPFLANRLVHMYSKSHSLPSSLAAFNDLPAKNPYSWNTLLTSLTNSGHLDRALHLLYQMPHPNIVAYNCVIAKLGRSGRSEDALAVFRRMRMEGCVGMDNYTVVGVCSACGALKRLGLIRKVHGVAVVSGLEVNLVASNALIGNYGKCGDFESARKVFDGMCERDELSWVSLLGAYSCAGQLEEVAWVFEKMPTRNVVAWTMMVSMYMQNEREEDAIGVFRTMVEEEVEPNSFTFVSVLSASAGLAIIGLGKQVHARIVRSCFVEVDGIFLCNALIDMYAKCGDMASALFLFEMMPERDVISWNSLITGFAKHGHRRQSLALFERMERSGIRPNHVTLLGVLSACNHAGFVSEGLEYFQKMEKQYGLCPKREHYAVVIDLLGRNSRLEAAVELLSDMPDGSGQIDINSWGSLLAACRVHGDVHRARRAAELLFKLEPANFGRYVMLSNVYAAAGQWDDSRNVRRAMRDRGLSKEPACSWIEVKNVRHAFIARDMSHPEHEEIHNMLFKLVDQMKESQGQFLIS